MQFGLELSVILTTYQRPKHLERSLVSLSLQRGVAGRFEVIVADDGSQDCTREVVFQFAKRVAFPVKFVSHPHRGFRVALCRNDGVRSSSAPYLLFSDSDCIFPPDHVEKHLLARRPGVVRAGNCLRLGQEATDNIDSTAIALESYRDWISLEERVRLFQKWIKEQYYQMTRHRTKPKLTGCNIGISRHDLEAVNGFDETFVGWGCEDDDLAFRLRRAGRRIASAVGYTLAYHMWHPTDPTTPKKWTEGPNVHRLQRVDRPIQCLAGLVSTVGISTSTNDANSERPGRHSRRVSVHVA